jgi:hypothetical protein
MPKSHRQAKRVPPTLKKEWTILQTYLLISLYCQIFFVTNQKRYGHVVSKKSGQHFRKKENYTHQIFEKVTNLIKYYEKHTQRPIARYPIY